MIRSVHCATQMLQMNQYTGNDKHMKSTLMWFYLNEHTNNKTFKFTFYVTFYQYYDYQHRTFA